MALCSGYKWKKTEFLNCCCCCRNRWVGLFNTLRPNDILPYWTLVRFGYDWKFPLFPILFADGSFLSFIDPHYASKGNHLFDKRVAREEIASVDIRWCVDLVVVAYYKHWTNVALIDDHHWIYDQVNYLLTLLMYAAANHPNNVFAPCVYRMPPWKL